MHFEHRYALSLEWTGDRGSGTSDHRSYGRDHVVRIAGKPDLLGSADRPFRGDADRWNPEDALLSALAQCHLLSYLHAAAAAGVVVVGYADEATGTMRQTADGGGHFVEVTLHPVVTVRDAAQVDLATSLHQGASERCFIASSVAFPVHHEPRTVVAAA
ncbi:OsmC family peroxiredoxin [Clavibacter tessellarius]|uniref:Peroxiredoxin n=1 Tax=Clavibacter tessellarius TaxID=31965 RepID=A0A225C920_9MICO|nr:OsmC family protein [Clavibacter michiganensis]MBT1637042.1 OsmC family protein [Clavibacter michiganensis]OQJ63237.1 peroxiredoxin [Clavibacter michiganensis subsp. tessellarius]UKF33783.1 OsmC family peroxiredoxin [Clavibacter michiganensis subsp. tessellarius]